MFVIDDIKNVINIIGYVFSMVLNIIFYFLMVDLEWGIISIILGEFNIFM